MRTWAWYWRIKRQHKPKLDCEALSNIDLFQIFKQPKPKIQLKSDSIISLYNENYFDITFSDGPLKNENYQLKVDKQKCNFGGFRYYFLCPLCTKRMRKLYSYLGFLLCRNCLNLSYQSQKLTPSFRYLRMTDKIEKRLKNMGGSIQFKPRWMRIETFQKLRNKYLKYEQLHEAAAIEEFLDYYNNRSKPTK